MQAASFCITRSDEVKALNEKITAISERSSTFRAELDELRSEQENIRSSVISGIKHLEALVKNETDGRQEAVDNMTKEMEMKEKALKKVNILSMKEQVEKPPETDSIKSKIPSKTSLGKMDSTKSTKRHHHKRHQRQPGEQQFPIQVDTG